MRVSGLEWGLAVMVLVLAAVGRLQTSYEGLAAILVVIVAVSAALFIVGAIESARAGTLGRFLLMGAAFGFFWLGAFTMARQTVPFAIGARLPVFGAQYSIELVRQGILFTALFQLMLFVGYSMRIPMKSILRIVERREDESSPRGKLIPYLLAACALIPLLLSFSFDIEAVTASLTGGRGSNPAYQDVGLLGLITFFGMYGASLLLSDALLFQSFSRYQKLIIGIVVTAPFILGGTRHLWLFVGLPVGVIGFRMNAGRITGIRLTRWIAAALFLLIVVQVQFLVRQEGWSQLAELDPRELLETDATGQFEALLIAEALVPARHDYFREPAEPYFLIHWIPRRIWPEKPVMESWTFYNDAYTAGDERFNVTPSVIGQFYMNWGIFGVIYIGAFLGALMASADRALLLVDPTKQRAMTVAIGSFIAFIVTSYRFYSPIYFTYFAFAWIGMLLITRRRRTPRAAPLGDRRAGDLSPVTG